MKSPVIIVCYLLRKDEDIKSHPARRSVSLLDKAELRGKLMRYALSLGFDYDIVQRAVENSLEEQDL